MAAKTPEVTCAGTKTSKVPTRVKLLPYFSSVLDPVGRQLVGTLGSKLRFKAFKIKYFGLKILSK
jgi:hypothetical protein